MARRSGQQGQSSHLRQQEKSQQREMLLQELERDRKMAQYYDEAIQREEKVDLM